MKAEVIFLLLEKSKNIMFVKKAEAKIKNYYFYDQNIPTI